MSIAHFPSWCLYTKLCSIHIRLHNSYVYLKVSVCMCVLSCSVMSDSATPWTEAHQAPLSMGFSRQEYRSGLPCPPPGDLPDPGVEPTSPASPALAGGFFCVVLPGKPS